MVNGTISTTLQNIPFEQWTAVSTDITFIISMIVVWLTPLVFYLIVASLTHARSSGGTKLKAHIIGRSETLIPIAIWTFGQGILILIFIIFPLWKKLVI